MRVVLVVIFLIGLVWILVSALLFRGQRREEKIVERQVVVTRCTFCSKMRAIDLASCEHCGAQVG